LIKNVKKLDKNILIYWLGLSGSTFGSAVYSIALPLIAYNLSGSTLTLGTTFAVQLLPALFFGFFTSYMSDKFESKKLLISTDLIQSFLLAILLFFMFSNTLNEIHIYIISFLMSSVVLISKPTNQVIIKENLPKDNLITFNSLQMFTRTSLELLGKIGGGLFVSLIGPFFAVAINISSFLFSAICILTAKLKSNKQKLPDNVGIISGFKAGINYVFSNPKVRPNSIRLVLLNMCIAPIFLSMPILAERLSGAAGIIYGLLSSSFLVGALFASIYAEKIKKKIKKEYIYNILVLLFALILPLIGLTTNIIMGCLILLVVGFLSDLTIIFSITFIQENTEEDIIGRVSSFNEIAIRTFLPIIFISMSWAIPHIGLFIPMFIISLIVAVLISVITFVKKNESNEIYKEDFLH